MVTTLNSYAVSQALLVKDYQPQCYTVADAVHIDAKPVSVLRDEDIPSSFRRAMADFKAGRTVDMGFALGNPPPDDGK